jgi:hypothetical protein
MISGIRQWPLQSVVNYEYCNILLLILEISLTVSFFGTCSQQGLNINVFWRTEVMSFCDIFCSWNPFCKFSDSMDSKKISYTELYFCLQMASSLIFCILQFKPKSVLSI